MSQLDFECETINFQQRQFKRCQKQKRLNAWRAFLKLIELQNHEFIRMEEFHLPPPEFNVTFEEAHGIFNVLYTELDKETDRLHGRTYDSMNFFEIESTMLYREMGNHVDRTRIAIVREFWNEYIQACNKLVDCEDQLTCPKCNAKTMEEFYCQNCQIEFHAHFDSLVTSLSPEDCPLHQFYKARGLHGIYQKPLYQMQE